MWRSELPAGPHLWRSLSQQALTAIMHAKLQGLVHTFYELSSQSAQLGGSLSAGRMQHPGLAGGPPHQCRDCLSNIVATSWPQRQAGRAPAHSNFPAAAGHYIWYYLTLNVTEAPPIATIDVSAAVRKAVAVQLDISNPLNEPASFSVAYGSNMLVGPRHVALAPLQSMHFELFYAPLLPGDSEAELVFSSIKVCWAYRLQVVPVPDAAEAGGDHVCWLACGLQL